MADDVPEYFKIPEAEIVIFPEVVEMWATSVSIKDKINLPGM